MTSSAVMQSVVNESALNPFGEGSLRSLPFKVVVCGLGRTGTTSMRTALDILGFRAYHSTELWLDSQENVELWMRAFDWKYKGKGKPLTRNEWDQILGNYMSAIDAPAAFFAAEFAELYPDAKVVILNRDPDSWFQSCRSALSNHQRGVLGWIYPVIFFWDPRLRTLGRYMRKKQEDVWGFEWDEEGAREKALAFFEDYYTDFRARVPEERRLEFHVRDGWGPLCAHLGVELPMLTKENGERVEMPFPRTNEAGEFKAKVAKMKAATLKGALTDWTRAIIFAAGAGYGMYVYLGPVARVALRWARNRT